MRSIPLLKMVHTPDHRICPLHHNTFPDTRQMSSPQKGLEQTLLLEQLCPRWQKTAVSQQLQEPLVN